MEQVHSRPVYLYLPRMCKTWLVLTVHSTGQLNNKRCEIIGAFPRVPRPIPHDAVFCSRSSLISVASTRKQCKRRCSGKRGNVGNGCIGCRGWIAGLVLRTAKSCDRVYTKQAEDVLSVIRGGEEAPPAKKKSLCEYRHPDNVPFRAALLAHGMTKRW
ncbi:hypothetical protein MRX96_025281 [Rhipicephalus microplus]